LCQLVMKRQFKHHNNHLSNKMVLSLTKL
jgi:hypothetical protein